MRPQQFNILKDVDKPLLIIYLILVFIGVANVYAAEIDGSHKAILDFSHNHGKQILFAAISLLIASIILSVDIKIFTSFSYAIYWFFILVLISVLIFGTEIKATKAWFQIGGFAIQPSEFAKFATAMVIAKYISSVKGTTIKFKNRLKAFILIAIPTALVLMQNDTGTTLVFGAFVFVLYREGYVSGIILAFIAMAIFLFVLTLLINEIYIIAGIVSLTIIISIIIRKKKTEILQLIGVCILLSAYVYSVDYCFENILQHHQKERITVLIDDEIDMRGPGYNLNQSKIAIGSGGLWGKGYLEGTQTKFDFVPEQGTDFIFCTIGEEWGFAGSTTLILIYMIFLIRIVLLAEKQRSIFSRIYGYSVASILFFHFAINIGMTIGLVPVIGIPLPFLSYGGSSMVGFTILLFIFLKLDAKKLER